MTRLDFQHLFGKWVPSFSPEKRRSQTGPERAAKIEPDLNQSVCIWYYFVVSENEYHIEVCDGEYAAIGPQSKLHVGQSAVTPTGLVYDLITSLCHVYFNLFVSQFSLKFRNVETVVGEKLRICHIRCQWWFKMSWFLEETKWDTSDEFGKIRSLSAPQESLVTAHHTTVKRGGGD